MIGLHAFAESSSFRNEVRFTLAACDGALSVGVMEDQVRGHSGDNSRRYNAGGEGIPEPEIRP